MPRKLRPKLKEGEEVPPLNVIELDGATYPLSSPSPDLTEDEEKFCIQFVLHNNATEAGKAIKPSFSRKSAANMAYKILEKEPVRRRIAQIRGDIYRCRLQTLVFPTLNALGEIVQSDIMEFLDDHLRLDPMRIRRAKASGVISEVSRTYGRSQKDTIKLYNKIEAAKTLLQVFVGKMDLSGTGDLDDGEETSGNVLITRPDNGRLPPPA